MDKLSVLRYTFTKERNGIRMKEIYEQLSQENKALILARLAELEEIERNSAVLLGATETEPDSVA